MNSSAGTDVLLVSMPFSPLLKPSIGLSLLQATLRGGGRRCKILYCALPFGRIVGCEDYRQVAEGKAYRRALAGEWVFAESLHGNSVSRQAYLREALSNESLTRNRCALSSEFRPVEEAFIDKILWMADRAPQFIDDCLEELTRFRPGIVGFSSTFQQHVASLALAKRVRAHLPDTFIVFGGANCQGVMGAETARQFPFLDAVVSGEAELIFPELVQRALEGRCVEGIPGVYTPGGVRRRFLEARFEDAPRVQNMDALPFPDYQEYFFQFQTWDMETEAGRKPDILFETSRGCWWGEKSHCTFCGLNGSGMAHRSKSSTRALDELRHLAGRHPGLTVEVVDNILDIGYFKDFIPALAESEEEFQFFYETKANLTKPQLELLHRAGIRFIQPGIESFCSDILKLMGKGVSAVQNIQLLKWCREIGIRPYWNIIWGFPGESPESYARMAELVPLLAHLEPPLCGSQLNLDRFSPNFDLAEELGFSDVRPHAGFFHIYPFAESAVHNLAYSFDYGYRDPQPVESYTANLLEQISIWQQARGFADLFFQDSGEELRVWDFRPNADDRLTRLGGLERECYLLCDQACTPRQLIQALARTGRQIEGPSLEGVLRRSLERGLMVWMDGRYLSLALPLGRYQPKAETMREFWSLLLGSSLSPPQRSGGRLGGSQ